MLAEFVVYDEANTTSQSVVYPPGAEGEITGRFDAGLMEVEIIDSTGNAALGWVDPRQFMVGR